MSISYYFSSDFVRNKGTACDANTCYSPKDFADTSRIHTWSYSVNIGDIRATDVTTHLTLFCTMVQCWRRARVFPLGIWNRCSYIGLNYPEAFSQVCSNQVLRIDPQYQHHWDPFLQNIPYTHSQLISKPKKTMTLDAHRYLTRVCWRSHSGTGEGSSPMSRGNVSMDEWFRPFQIMVV